MPYTDFLDTVQKLYIAYYGRPADPVGQRYWAEKLDAGATVASIIDAFGNSSEATALYAGMSDAAKVNAIYQQCFGRDADVEGLNYYTLGLTNGTFSAASIALNVQNGATGTDATAVANKLAAANLYTAALDTTDEIVAYSGSIAAASARAYIATVNDTAASLTAATAAVDTSVADMVSGVSSSSDTVFTLTTGVDNLTGTPRNDTFIAIDDTTLATTMTLGDTINGGGGDDTLKIFSDNDDLNLAKIQVSSIENLKVLNSQSDWDDIDIANRDFKTILLDVGGLESGGLDVVNVLASTAVTLTNIYADDETNYINFNTDTTSAVGNTNVTISNVDMTDYEEYFETYADFTAASTVNTTVNLMDINDYENYYDGGYYHYLSTGDTKDVAINATFNIENVFSADVFEVDLYVDQAGGSVNNITVNLTNVDNIDLDLYPDNSGNGTSATDVVTFNLDGVANSNDSTDLYVTDAETLNVNVLSDSVVENIGDYYNDDGTPMGNTTVNLNLGGNLTVDFWDLNDTGGTTENTAFNITGSGNLSIADLDDGNSNVTIGASTASGKIKILGLNAEVVSVTTGSGNDWLQLGGFTTIVSTGSGDDKVDINGNDYGNAKAKTIDGGDGTDSIVINDGTLLTAALAANISGFEVLDVTGSVSGVAYDMSKESSLAAVTGMGSLGAVSITNAAAGTTVSLTSLPSVDSTVTSLTYALKTATGLTDNFSLAMNALDTETYKTGTDKDGQLTISAVTANSIETFSISSNATTTDGTKATKSFTAGDYVNTISSLSGDAVKTLTLTGDADMTISDVTAAKLTKVDASGMTGQLNITLDGSANVGAIAILAGSAADTIDMTGNIAANNIIVGNGGADKITLAAAGTKETVRYASDTDSVLTLKDTTVPVVTPVVYDTATGFDIITNFTTGEDKIELSSALGLQSGDARSAIAGKGTIGDGAIADNAELAGILQTLIGTGVGFFNDGASDRAIATAVVDDAADYLMVFIDTNADGNFTNGVDQTIQLAGVTSIVINDVVFG